MKKYDYYGDILDEEEVRELYIDYARECAHYGEHYSSFDEFMSEFKEVEDEN